MAGAGELTAWTAALNLAGYEVVHVAEDEGGLRLSVLPLAAFGVCPDCGCASDHVHQKRWSKGVVDLPLGGREVRLKVRTLQFRCEQCDRIWTPPCPVLAPGASATLRFVAKAAACVRRSDVAAAAALFGVPEKTLEGWYYAHVERQRAGREEDARPVCSIGIDELSLKKSTGSSSP
jgi:transposase